MTPTPDRILGRIPGRLSDRHELSAARGWLPRSVFHLSLALLIALAAFAAHAQEDPPGRVGRLADLRGAVSWWDHETGRWTDAERNQPLTSGDRVSTAGDGRVDLRVGSTTLRLAEGTELEVLRLDDERMSFQLHSGSLALRVRSRAIADELEVVTAEARLVPLTAGHYRIDRSDDTAYASAWRGELRIQDPAGFVIVPGQRVEIQREYRSGQLRFKIGAPQSDRFAEAVRREEQRDERSVSAKYVSPEMTGIEDLDRNGRWEQHPDYGAIWLPLEVRAGWAPYRDGRWAWVRPWGWTWVDNAPWGFAPFHYGRWVFWRSNWAWVPGAYVARPVYSPALVGWIGGSDNGFSVSVQIGGPRVGWIPLSPREVYAPVYRVTPGYRDRVNPTPRWRWDHAPGQVPHMHPGPRTWGNQTVPGAVTIAPREQIGQRPPGGRGWGEGRQNDRREDRRGDPRENRRDGRAPEQPSAHIVAPPPPPGASFSPVPSTRPPEAIRPLPRMDERRDDRRDERRDDRRDDRRDVRPERVEPVPRADIPQRAERRGDGPNGPGAEEPPRMRPAPQQQLQQQPQQQPQQQQPQPQPQAMPQQQVPAPRAAPAAAPVIPQAAPVPAPAPATPPAARPVERPREPEKDGERRAEPREGGKNQGN